MAIVRNNIVPFVSRRAGDECDHRFGVAHVEHFVRHPGLDVNEIAGFVFQHFGAPATYVGGGLVAMLALLLANGIKQDARAF